MKLLHVPPNPTPEALGRVAISVKGLWRVCGCRTALDGTSDSRGLPSPMAFFLCDPSLSPHPISLFCPHSPNPAALAALPSLDTCHLSVLVSPSRSSSATLTAVLCLKTAFWPQGLCTCCFPLLPGMLFLQRLACLDPLAPLGLCLNVLFS